MDSSVKYGLFFLGGLVAGVAGTVIVSKNGTTIKPLLAEALSRGIELKDAVMTKVEIVKENVEDVVAEAQQVAEERKEASVSPVSPASGEAKA